jgi:hypothetical protein
MELNMKQFNKVAFDGMFNAKLNDLRLAERVTKAALMDLSRNVWEAFHNTEDISYINRILEVLTPVNRKVAIEFFKEFSGFNFDEKANAFGRKNKKDYDAKKEVTLAWLEDPLNNIWTWAERNIEIAPKEFDAERLNKSVQQLMQKADKNGFKKADLLKAMLANGLTVDELIGFMGTLEGIELNVAG